MSEKLSARFAKAMQPGAEEVEVLHEFEVLDADGNYCASTSSPDRESALLEAMHYAEQYAQDGAVDLFEIFRRRIGRATPATAPHREEEA